MSVSGYPNVDQEALDSVKLLNNGFKEQMLDFQKVILRRWDTADRSRLRNQFKRIKSYFLVKM
uniref:Uncharacterized protein n=1 Tax=viral metagenome TaxID=1070528 RepID=A0A6C0I3V3_9ZZZZ